jgi:hypothetical protein
VAYLAWILWKKYHGEDFEVQSGLNTVFKDMKRFWEKGDGLRWRKKLGWNLGLRKKSWKNFGPWLSLHSLKFQTIPSKPLTPIFYEEFISYP